MNTDFIVKNAELYKRRKIDSRISILGIIISIILITIAPLGILGKLLFWSTFLTNYYYYFKNNDWKWSIKLSHIQLIGMLLLWMMLRAQNLLGLKYFTFMAILMCVYISNIPYKRISNFILALLYGIVVVMALFVRLTGELYTNPNIMALISTIICLLNYIYFPKKRKIIAFVSIPIIFLFGARSIFLALGVALAILYFVKERHYKLKNILLLIIILISGGLYASWDYIMSPEFNAFIFETTNKNFQSGRNLIWGAIFEHMKGWDWIIGVGGGIDHGQIVPEHFKKMSLHSSYVFMIFHYGFVGLSLLCLLFYKILNDLIQNGRTYSALLFLVFILRDFFEITLINNQMVIAILFWGWIANGWLEKSYHNIPRRVHDSQIKNSNSICILPN